MVSACLPLVTRPQEIEPRFVEEVDVTRRSGQYVGLFHGPPTVGSFARFSQAAFSQNKRKYAAAFFRSLENKNATHKKRVVHGNVRSS